MSAAAKAGPELRIEPRDDGLCPYCEENTAEAPHRCPFASEINDDDRCCTCCKECEHECAMDI